MPCRVAALAIAWLAALAPAPGLAQPGPAMVRVWEVPAQEACGTAASLDAEVMRLLGGDPERRRDQVRLSGWIEATGGSFALTLALAQADGTPLGSRVLSAGDCASLAEAAALLVALTIDPGAVAQNAEEGQTPAFPDTVAVEVGDALDSPAAAGGPAEGASAPALDSPAALSGPEDRPPAPAELDTEARAWPTELSLDGSLLLELGTLPAPAAGLGLGVRLARRRLRAGVGVAGLFPRRRTLDRGDGTGAEARFFGLLGRLELGVGFARSLVRFDAAAVLDLALVGGTSSGVTDPDRGIGAFALGGALARVLVRVGHVGLGVEVDLRAAVTRPRFEILGRGEVHRPNAWVGRVGLLIRYPVRP